MPKSEGEYKQILASNPGCNDFVDYAVWLLREGRKLDALDVCLAGLSANPGAHAGRLVLARIFFVLKYYPFAVREVATLCAELPQSQALKKLLEKISGGAALADSIKSGTEDTVAEAEFDIDDLGSLDDIKNGN